MRYFIEIIPGEKIEGISEEELTEYVAIIKNEDNPNYRITDVLAINDSIRERSDTLKGADLDGVAGLYYELTDSPNLSEIIKNNSDKLTVMARLEKYSYTVVNHPIKEYISEPVIIDNKTDLDTRLLYEIIDGYYELDKLISTISKEGPADLEVKKILIDFLTKSNLIALKDKDMDGLGEFKIIPPSRGIGNMLASTYSSNVFIDITQISRYIDLFDKEKIYVAEYIKDADYGKEGYELSKYGKGFKLS